MMQIVQIVRRVADALVTATGVILGLVPDPTQPEEAHHLGSGAR